MNDLKDRHRYFANKATPVAWYEVAKLLHENAQSLRFNIRSSISYIDHTHKEITRTFIHNRPVFLLSGFALENILKAFLIYENPSYIENGKLANQVKTHSLLKLQNKCALVPYKNSYKWVFSAFEEGLNSWARYPCGLSYESKSIEKEITPKLWEGYNRVFELYSKRLEKLLSKKWVGPDGEISQVIFT